MSDTLPSNVPIRHIKYTPSQLYLHAPPPTHTHTQTHRSHDRALDNRPLRRKITQLNPPPLETPHLFRRPASRPVKPGACSPPKLEDSTSALASTLGRARAQEGLRVHACRELLLGEVAAVSGRQLRAESRPLEANGLQRRCGVQCMRKCIRECMRQCTCATRPRDWMLVSTASMSLFSKRATVWKRS